MRGLEIARAYFESFGLPMLRERFPQLLPHVAAGLTGSGSECYGYDDDVSRDHDFEPGFCLFLPGEDVVSRRDAFLLERAYAALPREFMGCRRSLVAPVGGARRGVCRTEEFYRDRVGSPDGHLTMEAFLTLPSYALSEAVNGEIFYDGPGTVTEIRTHLRNMPEDARRKRLASHLLLMAQAGQYNYPRCCQRGDEGAAQLALYEFAKSAMQVVFLLNHAYMPYYKWAFRAMRDLPRLSLLSVLLEYLLTTGNDRETAEEKRKVVEDICGDVADEVRSQGLSSDPGQDLERQAYAVQRGIRDPGVRNLHILTCA